MSFNAAQTSEFAPVRMKRQPRKLSGSFRWIKGLLCLAPTIAFVSAAQAQELSSDTLRLLLNVTPEGIPVIEEAVWQATGQTAFRDLGTPDGLAAWVPEALIPQARWPAIGLFPRAMSGRFLVKPESLL